MKLNPQFINLMFLFHFLSPWIILFLLAQLTYCKTPSAFKTHMQIRYIFLHFFLPILKQVIFFKLSYTFFSAILPSSPRILPRPVTPTLPISSDLLLAFLAKIMCSIYSYQFKTGDFLSSKVNLCLLSGLLISNLFLFYSSSPLRSFFFLFFNVISPANLFIITCTGFPPSFKMHVLI